MTVPDPSVRPDPTGEGKRRVRTLTKRQRKGLRVARRCVMCCASYPADIDRSALYVFPDGCTAHDECAMRDEDERAHWHSVEAKQEDDYRQHVQEVSRV
jgi:hypothetical protein